MDERITEVLDKVNLFYAMEKVIVQNGGLSLEQYIQKCKEDKKLIGTIDACIEWNKKNQGD